MFVSIFCVHVLFPFFHEFIVVSSVFLVFHFFFPMLLFFLRVRSYQLRAREILMTYVSSVLTEMCPEHIRTSYHLNLTRLLDRLAVSMDKKVVVAFVDSEGTGQQSVPNGKNGQWGI